MRSSNWRFNALVIAVLAICVSVVSVMVAYATPPNPEHKVTICHRTGSATNPYVIITVDIASSGYVKGGHNHHEQVGNGVGGDIIPPYTYTSKSGVVFEYPGKGDQSILANDCRVASPSPPPSPPISVGPSTPPPSISVNDGDKEPKQHKGNLAETGPEQAIPGAIAGLSLLLAGLGALRYARRGA